MTRARSITFAGSSIYDTDADALTFKRVIKNAVADTALVHDICVGYEQAITGAAGAVMTVATSSPLAVGQAVEVVDASTGVVDDRTVSSLTATTVTLSSAPSFVVALGDDLLRAGDSIIHDGTAGRGALLGVPLVQQFIGRRVGYDFSGGGSVTDKSGGTSTPAWLLAVPIFIPPGEANYLVEVVGELEQMNPRAYFRTSAFASVGDESVVPLEQVGGGRAQNGLDTSGIFIGRFTGLTTGLRLFFVEIDADTTSGNPRLTSWRIYSDRQRAPVQVDRSTEDIIPVTTPGASEGVAHVNFDGSLFADNEALHGYITAKLNRNLNGLSEYITGYPAGGDATYVHEDQTSGGAADSTNPDRSRFLAHTRTQNAGEPEIAWPLWCEAFGAFKLDGGYVVNEAEPPTNGMLGWYAPWPLDGTLTTIRQLRLRYPDFQSTASRLKLAVLVGSDAGTIGDWDTTITNTAGSATGAFAAVTGTPAANKLALATATAVPFTGDGIETTQLQLVKTRAAGARTIDSICLLGACLYYEPVR